MHTAFQTLLFTLKPAHNFAMYKPEDAILKLLTIAAHDSISGDQEVAALLMC